MLESNPFTLQMRKQRHKQGVCCVMWCVMLTHCPPTVAEWQRQAWSPRFQIQRKTTLNLSAVSTMTVNKLVQRGLWLGERSITVGTGRRKFKGLGGDACPCPEPGCRALPHEEAPWPHCEQTVWPWGRGKEACPPSTLSCHLVPSAGSSCPQVSLSPHENSSSSLSVLYRTRLGPRDEQRPYSPPQPCLSPSTPATF